MNKFEEDFYKGMLLQIKKEMREAELMTDNALDDNIGAKTAYQLNEIKSKCQKVVNSINVIIEGLRE